MHFKFLAGILVLASVVFAVEPAENAAAVEQSPVVADAPAMESTPVAGDSVAKDSLPVSSPVQADTVAAQQVAPGLDLSKLTAQDTEDYGEYTRRIALLEDSIKVTEEALRLRMESATDILPPLEPKGENESDSAYEARQFQYDVEKHKAMREKEDAAAVMARLGEMKAAVNTLKKIQMEMFASLLVNTVPEKASVKISSQPQTLESPARFTQVVPESLTVSVNLDGYVSQNLPLVLKARENKEIDVTLVALADASEKAKDGWTWRGYARVSSLVAAAGFLGAGLLENKIASDRANDYNNLAVRTQKDRDAAEHDINQRQTLRGVYYGIAGALAVFGVATFFF
ncbi:hypothetical protein [Fibrobacter sp.]|uniref:hypothetical protein n=1 Tax=Fibrobacter sp. TaxID=35828 RepID=UPI001B1A04FE|nr:hypothetical protein [Fibrobacter sp.]MBO7061338.1 hypothetical protein [Fibrobacter sp.]